MGVRLEPLAFEHLDRLYEISVQPYNVTHWRSRGRLWSADEFRRRVLHGGLSIVAKIDGGVIGLVELLDLQLVDRKAHCAALFDERWHLTGLPAAAVAQFWADTFERVEIDKIVLSVLADDHRLVPGLRRHFAQEAHLRREINCSGVWHDLLLFAVWREQMPLLGGPRHVAATPMPWEAIIASVGCDAGGSGSDDLLLSDLDSLAALELHASIEQLIGRELDLDAILACRSLGAVRHLVESLLPRRSADVV